MEITETLFGKTFLILGTQLLITWLATLSVLSFIKRLYLAKHHGFSATTNHRGELDIHLSFEISKPYVWTVLILDILLFLILVFLGRNDLSIGIPVFTLWSIVTGILLAFTLVSVDENLGSRVLALTTSVTFVCAVIGIYSGVDFSFMGQGLLIGLMALLAGNIFRIFVQIERWKQRAMALFGVLIFVGYLLFDFHRLSQSNKSAELNTWPVAMDMAMEIYLDIINLFIDLLDLLSE